MNRIEEYVKKYREMDFSDEDIRKVLAIYKFPEHEVEHALSTIKKKKHILPAAAMTILLIMVLAIFIKPNMLTNPTGLVIQENIAWHTDYINSQFNSSAEYEWHPNGTGEINSIMLSGKIIGSGTAKIIITDGSREYVLFDSARAKMQSTNGLTGFIVNADNSNYENITILEETTNTVENATNADLLPAANTQTQTLLNDNASGQENNASNINATNKGELNTTETVATNASEANENSKQNLTEAATIESVVDANLTNSSKMQGNSAENTTNSNTVQTNSTQMTQTMENSSLSSLSSDEFVNQSKTQESTIQTTQKETAETLLFSDVCDQTCAIALNQTKYNIKVIVDNASVTLDSIKYSTKEFIEINQTKINDTKKENISSEINLSQNMTNASIENVTTNISINKTESNVSLNLTNMTLAEITNITIDSNAQDTPKIIKDFVIEINKPVKWIYKVNTSNYKKIMIPKETFNITSKDRRARIVVKNQELTLEQYNAEKERSILLKKTIVNEKQNNQQGSKSEATAQDTDAIKKRIKELEKITKNITIDENVSLLFNYTSTENNTQGIEEVEYLTEGPKSDEVIVDKYHKIFTVSSDIHYENIKAYTNIIESKPQMISVYWLTPNGKQNANAKYIDTNGNGLIDRIEWIVPHLSNQSYEISISVLNVQSYPQVGGTWKVEFTTTGTANLTITAEDGTVFGKDIVHESLMCGETTLNPVYDGTKVFYENYECNTTGYHIVRVLTQGHHTRKFTFGNVSAYAFNFAGNLPKTINIHGRLDYSNSTKVNVTSNFTFRLYDANTNGNLLWEENQTIDVAEGIYTAILGSVNQITLNFSQPYFMGVKVNGDSEMTPRINLTNTPYSYNSFYAEEARKLLCTDCVGNNEINTTGLFMIDGNLNATNNITLGNSILDADNKARISMTNNALVINLD